MITLIPFFIIWQLLLLVTITLHDWVHVPPLTDIRTLEKQHSKKERFFNSSLFFLWVFVPLVLTWYYQHAYPWWVLMTLAVFYAVLTVGTIFSWWVPYFFGSSQSHKTDFQVFKNTHRFLPVRGDNVIPNTFHVLMHLQIWICFAISLYLLIK